MNPGKTWCQSLYANVHVMKCKCLFIKLVSQGLLNVCWTDVFQRSRLKQIYARYFSLK